MERGSTRGHLESPEAHAVIMKQDFHVTMCIVHLKNYHLTASHGNKWHIIFTQVRNFEVSPFKMRLVCPQAPLLKPTSCTLPFMQTL